MRHFTESQTTFEKILCKFRAPKMLQILIKVYPPFE